MNSLFFTIVFFSVLLCGLQPCTGETDTLDIDVDEIQFPEGEWIKRLAVTECGNILALGRRVVYSISQDGTQIDTVLESSHHDWLQDYIYQSEYTNEVFVVDGRKIVVTSDCGNSWQTLDVPNDDVYGTSNIEIDANGTMYLARVAIGLYVSTDRENWEVSCKSKFFAARDMAVGGDGTVFIGSDAPVTIRYSKDTCQVVDSPNMRECGSIRKVNYIDIIDEKTLFLFFDEDSGMISHDAGDTWECFDTSYKVRRARKIEHELKLGVVFDAGGYIKVFIAKGDFLSPLKIRSIQFPHFASDAVVDKDGFLWVCGENSDNTKKLVRSQNEILTIVDVNYRTEESMAFCFFDGNQIVVEHPTQKASRIEIYNLLGRRVYSESVRKNSRIQLPSLNPGVFLILLLDSVGNTIGTTSLLME